MVTRFRTYCRTLLAGSLVFAGAIAVSVVGGSQSAPPAAATTPSAWTAYVVSYNDDAVIPVNTATDVVGTPITVGSGPSAIAITPNATTAYVTDEGTTNTAPGFVTPIDLLDEHAGYAHSRGFRARRHRHYSQRSHRLRRQLQRRHGHPDQSGDQHAGHAHPGGRGAHCDHHQPRRLYRLRHPGLCRR